MKRSLLAVGWLFLAAGCYSRGLKPLDTQPVPTVAAPASSAEPQLREPVPATPARDSVVVPKPADVQRTVAKVFGDSIAEVPLIDVPIQMDGPTWDIDVRSYETQERVAYYVNFFTQNSRYRFLEKLKLGTRYDSMIRGKLRAAGIPEDMTFLALVESGYDPNAYSSAAAVGMWQFMSSTARDVGLRVDWWVDERRDPARATDGAIRFLKDLQNQFGSLYLAAAAYNGGPGRVSRGLTRFAEEMEGASGEDRFFALAEQNYLRSETKNYVPQIIAAALIGKEPVRYGLKVDTLPQYVYDSVSVPAGTPLVGVAAAAGVELAAIKELNPAVLRGMVPPTGPLWIRVPVNGVAQNDQILAALASLPDDQRVGYSTLKTKGTETKTSIAAKAGITSTQLSWFNPGLKATKKGKLLAGQSVRLPTMATLAAATNVPDPSIERYGSSTVAATRSGSVHIVKRGESLGRIAARYKVSVARLKSLNGMRGDRVVAGQALRVRGTPVARTSSSKPATRAAGKTTARTSTAAKATTKKPVAKKPAAKTTAAGAARKKTSKAATPTKKVAATKAATSKKSSGR